MSLLVLGVLLAILVLVIVHPASTPRIDRRRHPQGLAVLERVPVNGTRQWLLIRTENVANPVLLFLHGGPGTSELALVRRCNGALERHFTVVGWDQRGAGKSFSAGRDATTLTMRQFVDDTIAVSSYLAARFGKERILLVGHSWGSAIGMLAVDRRPDLFSAYVGVGQVSSMAQGETISYEWTLEQARKAGDDASVKRLLAMKPPPYVGAGWRSNYMTERRILGKYGGEYHGSSIGAFGAVLRSVLFSSEYTVLDRVNFFRGIFRSVEALYPELARRDLFVEVPEVHIPVFFCLGRHDWEVPSVLASRYFDSLRAPGKQRVWFEDSAHMPFAEEKDRFNEFMVDVVLPVLADAAPTGTEPTSAGH